MGKLIDITSRLNTRNNSEKSSTSKTGDVTSMVDARQAILLSERRELRRTILTEFVGAFVVVPGRGLLRVSLYDISENGLAFELETNEGTFELGERVAMRIYLNHKTYFEFVTEIRRCEEFDDLGFNRIGGQFVKDTVNDVALHHFVKFIEAVSVNLQADDGDLQASRGS